MLKILTIPENEKALRTKSRELSVPELSSAEIQTFIDEMIELASTYVTKEGWKSVGLAAVQVGKSIRVFIAKDRRTERFTVYINPSVELLGDATQVGLESCLSIPSTVGNVNRHKRIRISYLDRQGNHQTKKADGFEARILLHENDHLNGVLFTDIATEISPFL